MNQEQEQIGVPTNWSNYYRNKHNSARWTGAFLLLIGALLLARASGIPFPAWFFSGPVLIMAIGLFIGIKHRFRNFGWLIPFCIGALLLLDRLIIEINLRPYIWPLVFIGMGIFFIFRPKQHLFRGRKRYFREDNFQQATEGSEADAWQKKPYNNSNMVDITAIFGGVKKNILSKEFKGGDIVAFMGGAELNLTQADFTGTVTIDSFNMFGGTKLIIPADWEIQSDMVAIFGGIDDKRPPMPNSKPTKVLHLDGTCLFGGIEINSY